MPYSNFVGINLITAPVAAPVSVADAKAHSRVFFEADDSVIAGYIWTAMLACEDRTKRAFMPQAWRLTLSQWPGRTPATGALVSTNPDDYFKWNHFEVPKPPLQSVISFYYYDTNYNQYSMTQVGAPPLPAPTTAQGNYILETDPEPGEIQLPFAGIWPTQILIPGSAIVLSYNCGWPAYSGTMNVSPTGLCTTTGSPVTNFDQQISGTWITLNYTGGSPVQSFVGSYNVAQWISPTQIQLQVQQPSPLPFPLTGVSFTCNDVPMQIRTAILQVAAHFYENREPIVTGRSETAIEIPAMYDALLSSWKIYRS